jgi:hypothetical protein
MKHLKIFEINKSISSIKNIMSEYHDLMKYLFPAVIKRYNEIANDPKLFYGQDITDVYGGDSFTVIHSIDRVRLIEMKMHDNKIFFTLEYSDSYEPDEPLIFYVPFTEKELEKAIIEIDSNKYNI